MLLRSTLAIAAALVLLVTGLYVWTRVSPRELRAEVEIDATPAQVWTVLADFPAYPEWNPFIISAVGEARVGAKLTNELSNDGGVMTFKPKVLTATPGEELRWIGRFGMPGIVDGEHYFLLQEIAGGRTRLVQGETFTGVLVPFVGGMLKVEDDFAEMNAALKARVEKMAG
ncbi:SRPBCC family protein [Actinomadura sp. 9N407]|uniref:SRPBCC family protein n=1 Tax=Actinomadura sp. 9N407 TaxID=3375154 RepID=UPI003788AAD6